MTFKKIQVNFKKTYFDDKVAVKEMVATFLIKILSIATKKDLFLIFI